MAEKAVSRLFCRRRSIVYLLYLDESGNPDDPADTHFVLAGAAVHEDRTFYLARDLDSIQGKHFPGAPPIEFHASAFSPGRDSGGRWFQQSGTPSWTIPLA